MKKASAFFLLICLFSCTKPIKYEMTSSKLVHEKYDAHVSLEYPIFYSPYDSLNLYIRNFVLSYGQTTPYCNVNDLAQSLFSELDAVKKDFPEISGGWFIEKKVQPLFIKKDLVAVRLKEYYFTGGAHGMFTENYAYFKKNHRFGREDIFTDLPSLNSFLKKRLSAENGDYFFNKDNNSSPDLVTANVYATEDSLYFVYNPYEIAPYSYGIIKLGVPKREIAAFMRERFW